MATYQRKSVASDVAADNTSESLSFAGLLSIQDLHSKSPTAHSINHTKNHNQESDFSFSTTDFSANSLNKMSYTSASISNGKHQTQLQAFLQHSSNVQKPGSKAVTRRNNKPSNDKGKEKVSDRTKHRARNQENKERSSSSPSLGKKIFHSFVSPCRECHFHKPATRENSMPGETVRAY